MNCTLLPSVIGVLVELFTARVLYYFVRFMNGVL